MAGILDFSILAPVQMGDKVDGEDRFFHSDGSGVGVGNGTLFLWERCSASGEILRGYYPKDHCLEHKSLRLEVGVWGLLDQKPSLCSFIFVNPENDIVEMTFARLRVLCGSGELKISLATYRLFYDING
nr:hypothetical protein [Acetobacter persici]